LGFRPAFFFGPAFFFLVFQFAKEQLISELVRLGKYLGPLSDGDPRRASILGSNIYQSTSVSAEITPLEASCSYWAVLAVSPPPDRGVGTKTGAPRLLQAVSATANPIPTHLGPFKKKAGAFLSSPIPQLACRTTSQAPGLPGGPKKGAPAADSLQRHWILHYYHTTSKAPPPHRSHSRTTHHSPLTTHSSSQQQWQIKKGTSKGFKIKTRDKQHIRRIAILIARAGLNVSNDGKGKGWPPIQHPEPRIALSSSSSNCGAQSAKRRPTASYI
jgi:hypothetical protein